MSSWWHLRKSFQYPNEWIHHAVTMNRASLERIYVPDKSKHERRWEAETWGDSNVVMMSALDTVGPDIFTSGRIGLWACEKSEKGLFSFVGLCLRNMKISFGVNTGAVLVRCSHSICRYIWYWQTDTFVMYFSLAFCNMTNSLYTKYFFLPVGFVSWFFFPPLVVCCWEVWYCSF